MQHKQKTIGPYFNKILRSVPNIFNEQVKNRNQINRFIKKNTRLC